MTKDKAIQKIQTQKNEIEKLKSLKRFSPQFEQWHRDTEIAIEKIFGNTTRHIEDFKNVRYSSGIYIGNSPDSKYQKEYTDGLNSADAILNSFINEIKEYWDTTSQNKSVESDPINHLKLICTRFHKIAKQLQDRHNSRETLKIKDEYDVQDLFHSLLQLYFEDIRPEEWTPNYAGGSLRMDFLLKQEQIVIEIKKPEKAL